VPVFAEPPPPEVSGFAVGGRADAPTDARVPVAANYGPPAWVIDGAAPGTELASERIADFWPDIVVLEPPTAGWAAGAQYTVGIADGYADTWTGAADHELTFAVADRPAPDPVAPEVPDPSVEPWSDEEGRYPNGCCFRTRLVTFSVDNLDSDPWSMVLLTGEFPTDRRPLTLDVGVGPGAHTLSFLQWRQGREVHPACFTVVGVAADGDQADRESVCPAAPVLGCATTSGRGWEWLGAVVALVARRRR
jgi:hypothetical protein